MKLDFQKLYKVPGYMFTPDFVLPTINILLRNYLPKGFWVAFILIFGKNWNIGFRVYFNFGGSNE